MEKVEDHQVFTGFSEKCQSFNVPNLGRLQPMPLIFCFRLDTSKAEFPCRGENAVFNDAKVNFFGLSSRVT